jgi:hypothetical protein
MSMTNTPCGWAPAAPCSSGPCCPDVDTPENVAMKEQAEAVASAVLWRLTGLQYGCCEVTVRPCKPKTCDPLTLGQIIYWDSHRFGRDNNLGVLSYFPALLDGAVYNISCGCPTGCCTCKADCEIKLPGPICAVTSVSVDGELVAPANYTVYGNSSLVFVTDPENPAIDACPGCQNYNLPLGEVGTWSVTYSIGTPVPNDLNFAAGLYACQLAKSMVGDKSCTLPPGVQAVTRQGITESFWDPTMLAENGLTGIGLVDTIVKALNPGGLRQPSRAWYPGMTTTRRESA